MYVQHQRRLGVSRTQSGPRGIFWSAKPRMAMTVTEAFDRFLRKAVNLTDDERRQASRSHNHLRDLIKSKAASDLTLFSLIDGDFLTGSYDRGTKIRPLDDVDLFLVLDGTRLFVVENGRLANVAVEGSTSWSNPLLLPRYLTSNGFVSSQKVLLALRNALAQSFPKSRIRRDGQAVNVRLDSYQMGLDVVPAFHLLPWDGRRDYYCIPAGRGSSLWIPTNPKVDAELVSRWDEYHNRQFRPVVRLLKWWNVVGNQGRLRSYHLEVLCLYIFNIFSKEPISGYPAALAQFFREAQVLVPGPCPDPTGLGPPIDRYLDRESRRLTNVALQRASRLATRALTHSLFGKDADARRCWRLVFGPHFPAPPAATLSAPRFTL